MRVVDLRDIDIGKKIKGGYILTFKCVVYNSLFMPKNCKMTNKDLIFHIVFFQLVLTNSEYGSFIVKILCVFRCTEYILL